MKVDTSVVLYNCENGDTMEIRSAGLHIFVVLLVTLLSVALLFAEDNTAAEVVSIMDGDSFVVVLLAPAFSVCSF